MKKKKRINKIFKFLFIIYILFIVIIIYFYNDKLLELKSISASIFNLNRNNYSSKENVKITELQKEINELKELNNINEINIDYDYIDARVIKRNNSYWNESLTINSGKNQGIKKGYAVTYKNNLIGIISSVNKNSSNVRLITCNLDNYISGKFTIDNKDYFGIIKRYDIIKNELYLDNVIGDFNINNEDVITSGLEGNIPSGIYIGKIIGIKKDKYNLSSTIIIKPSIDYNDMKYVKVIIK